MSVVGGRAPRSGWGRRLSPAGAAVLALALLGAPARVWAEDLDLCGFAESAIVDSSENFTMMLATPPDGRTSPYPVKPNFTVTDASACYASEVNGKDWYVACDWDLDVTTAAAADARVASTVQELTACLGSGYQQRPRKAGGVLLSVSPNEDRIAVVEGFADGRYKLFVEVLGPGMKLE